MKPTYSFEEVIYLIWRSETSGDCVLINSIVIEEKKLYTLEQLDIMKALMKAIAE